MNKIGVILFLVLFISSWEKVVGQASFCGTTTSQSILNNNFRISQSNVNLDFQTTYVCRLGIIIDSETFEFYDRDTLTVKKQIADLIARVSEIYLKEMNIQISAEGFKIYKSKSEDPFKDADDAFKGIAKMPDVDPFGKNNIDKVILLTSKKWGLHLGNLGGRYATSAVNDVKVTAHELGHTMGSFHTHDCRWQNSVLDPCLSPENGDCGVTLDQQYPATIMSYGGNFVGNLEFKFPEIINTIRNHAISNFKIIIDKKPNEIQLNTSYTLNSNLLEFVSRDEGQKFVLETSYPDNTVKFDSLAYSIIKFDSNYTNLSIRVKAINRFGESNWSNYSSIIFGVDFIEIPNLLNTTGDLINVYPKTILNFEISDKSNTTFEYSLHTVLTIQAGFEDEKITSKIINSKKIEISIPPYSGNEMAYKLKIRSINGEKKSLWREYILLNEPNRSALDLTLIDLKNKVNDRFPVVHKRINLGGCRTPTTKLTLAKDNKFENIVTIKTINDPNTYVSTYFNNLLPNQKYFIKTEDFYDKSYKRGCNYSFIVNSKIDSFQTVNEFAKKTELIHLDKIPDFGSYMFNAEFDNMTLFNNNLVFKNIPRNTLSFINTSSDNYTEKDWGATDRMIGTISGLYLYRKNILNNNLIIPTWHFSGKTDTKGNKQALLNVVEVDPSLKLNVIDSFELLSPFNLNPPHDFYYHHRLFRYRTGFYSITSFNKVFEMPTDFNQSPRIFENATSTEFLMENYSNKKENLLVNLAIGEKVKVEKISQTVSALFGNCDVNKLLYSDGINKWFFAFINNQKGGLIYFNGKYYQKFENNSPNFNFNADYLNIRMAKGPLGDFFGLIKSNSPLPTLKIIRLKENVWESIYEFPAYGYEIIDFDVDEKGQFWIKDRAGIFKLNLCKNDLKTPDFEAKNFYLRGETINIKIPDNYILKFKYTTASELLLDSLITNSKDFIYQINKSGQLSIQYLNNGCLSEAVSRKIEVKNTFKILPPVKSSYCIGDSLLFSVDTKNNPGVFDLDVSIKSEKFTKNYTLKSNRPGFKIENNFGSGDYEVFVNSKDLVLLDKNSFKISINEIPFFKAPNTKEIIQFNESKKIELNFSGVPPIQFNNWKDSLISTSSNSYTFSYLGNVPGNFTLKLSNIKDKFCLNKELASFEIVVQSPLSIEPDISRRIKLFPNPSDGNFWVEIDELKSKWNFEIFDYSGKLVFIKSNISSKNNKELVQLKLNSGIYIIKVTESKKSFTTKFYIENR